MNNSAVLDCLRHYLSGETPVENLVKKVMGRDWSLDLLLTRCQTLVFGSIPAPSALAQSFRDKPFVLPSQVTGVGGQFWFAVLAERNHQTVGHEAERLAILVREFVNLGDEPSTFAVSVVAYRINSIRGDSFPEISTNMELVCCLLDPDCQAPLIAVQPQFDKEFQQFFCDLATPLLVLSLLSVGKCDTRPSLFAH